jgi:uncharacterized protein
MLFQVAEAIKSLNATANIQYINKELDEFRFIRSDSELINYLESRSGEGNNILMIDEVQEIENFEDGLRSLLASKKWDLWITGRNASMFSSDIAGKLSGRHIEILINSLSFIEFIEFQGLTNSDEALIKYLRYGGLPYLMNVELSDNIAYEYLKNIYSTILFKDILQRHHLRNSRFLEDLILLAADNTGSMISAKRISDFLKAQGIRIPPNLVLEYLKYITDAFLLYMVRRSDLQGKRIFEIGEKYYFNDLGLRHSIKGFLPNDIGKIIENVIFLHLKNCDYQIYTGLDKGKEVDFVCIKGNAKIYIQAAYQISNDEVFRREFGNLEQITDNFPKYVVTMDPVKWDSYEGIKHVQLREFLSKNDW